MPNYIPPEPSGDNASLNWAQKTHRTAQRERRVLNVPGMIISQTTHGVFQRVKPGTQDSGKANVLRWG